MIPGAGSTAGRVAVFLTLLGILGFSLRVLFGLGFSGYVAGDAPSYDALAKALAEGRGYVNSHTGEPTAFRPPGYPFFLAAVYRAYPQADLRLFRVLQAVLSACTILAVYSLARACAERKIALVAAALFAVYPSSIFFSALLITETLAVFLLVLFLLLLTRAIREEGRRRTAWLAASGVLLGLSTLVRPITLLLPLYLIALLLLVRRPLPINGKQAAVALFGFCLVLLPWTVRNYQRFHRLVPVCTVGGVVIWQGLQPDPRGYGFTPWEQIEQVLPPELDEVEAYHFLVKDTLRFAIRHPARTLWLSVVKVASLFSPFDGKRCGFRSSFNPIYGVVLMSALWAAWKYGRASIVLKLFGAVIFYFILMSVVFYGSPRFRLAFEPLLIVFSAVGIVSLYRGGNKWSGRYLLWAVLGLNLLFYVIANPLIRRAQTAESRLSFQTHAPGSPDRFENHALGHFGLPLPAFRENNRHLSDRETAEKGSVQHFDQKGIAL